MGASTFLIFYPKFLFSLFGFLRLAIVITEIQNSYEKKTYLS